MKSFPFKFRRSHRNALTEYCIPKSMNILVLQFEKLLFTTIQENEYSVKKYWKTSKRYVYFKNLQTKKLSLSQKCSLTPWASPCPSFVVWLTENCLDTEKRECVMSIWIFLEVILSAFVNNGCNEDTENSKQDKLFSWKWNYPLVNI